MIDRFVFVCEGLETNNPAPANVKPLTMNTEDCVVVDNCLTNWAGWLKPCLGCRGDVIHGAVVMQYTKRSQQKYQDLTRRD